MKKIFTICLFVFGLFLATNTANAQQSFSAEVNTAAQTKTVEMSRLVKANKTTQESMYIAYQEFYAKSETLNSLHKVGTSGYADLEKKINDRLASQMQEALNEEQYSKFLEITEIKL
ncbi:hypothetical protein [uncultured Olleya sp.]|uniref:hypothetical protein n=1 Tax=uncultured Olleya sp. TaxID=757243 RepID=UPI002594177D|nr:hypothetical protein [uncultured Olleya sp.]